MIEVSHPVAPVKSQEANPITGQDEHARAGNVAVYAFYSVLCHVLTREAAENIGRPDKAVSPTFFNT